MEAAGEMMAQCTQDLPAVAPAWLASHALLHQLLLKLKFMERILLT